MQQHIVSIVEYITTCDPSPAISILLCKVFLGTFLRRTTGLYIVHAYVCGGGGGHHISNSLSLQYSVPQTNPPPPPLQRSRRVTGPGWC